MNIAVSYCINDVAHHVGRRTTTSSTLPSWSSSRHSHNASDSPMLLRQLVLHNHNKKHQQPHQDDNDDEMCPPPSLKLYQCHKLSSLLDDVPLPSSSLTPSSNSKNKSNTYEANKENPRLYHDCIKRNKKTIGKPNRAVVRFDTELRMIHDDDDDQRSCCKSLLWYNRHDYERFEEDTAALQQRLAWLAELEEEEEDDDTEGSSDDDDDEGSPSDNDSWSAQHLRLYNLACRTAATSSSISLFHTDNEHRRLLQEMQASAVFDVTLLGMERHAVDQIRHATIGRRRTLNEAVARIQQQSRRQRRRRKTSKLGGGGASAGKAAAAAAAATAYQLRAACVQTSRPATLYAQWIAELAAAAAANDKYMNE